MADADAATGRPTDVVPGRRRARRVSLAPMTDDRNVLITDDRAVEEAPSEAVTLSVVSDVPAATESEAQAGAPATHEGLSIVLDAGLTEPALPPISIPATAETPATISEVTASDAEDDRTEQIPALASPAMRGAQTVSRVRMQARASMAVATSIVVGFGAASVIAGGQSAAAVTGSPVVTSLEQDEIDATVPAAFAKRADAAEIDRVRGAQALAESTPPKPAVCGDESANGLTAALTETSNDILAMPVKTGTYRISSGYGPRWNPIAGGYQFHLGSDFAAELGTPIYAIADGTVEYVGLGKDGRSNNLVIIRHEIGGDVFWSWYVHMYDDGIHVVEGEEVTVGQHIADVGNNGRSTGPHLHLEIHTQDGATVNPTAFLADRGARDVSNLCS